MLCTWTVIFLCSIAIILKSSFVVSEVNCCSLNQTALLALKTEEIEGPCLRMIFETGNIFAELDAKCDTCPEGTCRVDMSCYCIDEFLFSRESPKPRTLCEYSFKVVWPGSVGKEDTTWRSCLRKPNPTRVEDNCCSLTKDELEARVGTSNLCPTRNTSVNPVGALVEKCDLCLFRTYRVGLNCYCPKDFLESPAYHELCRPSFTDKWYWSIGHVDTHWRSCTKQTPSQDNTLDTTFDNCCALTNEQLKTRIGTSNSCPLFGTSISDYVKPVDKECDPCLYGTCRAASSCFCPADFLNSDAQKALCQESFGDVHPESVGKPDTLCPTNPTTEVQSPETSTSPDGNSSLIPSSTISPIPSDHSEGLNAAEVIGIVTGIIGALSVFLGCFICIRQQQWKKKSGQIDKV